LYIREALSSSGITHASRISGGAPPAAFPLIAARGTPGQIWLAVA